MWSGATPAAGPDAGEKESCVYRREVLKQEARVGLGKWKEVGLDAGQCAGMTDRRRQHAVLEETKTTDNQRDVHRGWLDGRVRRLSSEEVDPGHAHSLADEAVRLGAGEADLVQ